MELWAELKEPAKGTQGRWQGTGTGNSRELKGVRGGSRRHRSLGRAPPAGAVTTEEHSHPQNQRGAGKKARE